MWSHLPWHAEQAPGSAKGNASAGLLTVVWTSQGLQSGFVHQRLILRQGTRIPRNQARKRQTRCAAPSKSSAFLGTVGQRQAVEEAAKHLPLGGVGRVGGGPWGQCLPPHGPLVLRAADLVVTVRAHAPRPTGTGWAGACR